MKLDFIEEIKFFSSLSEDYLRFYGFLKDKKLWESSLSEILFHIGALDYHTFVYIMANERKKLEQFKNKANGMDLQKRCMSFLKTYYYDYFVNDISYAEPFLIRKLKKEYDYCQKIGLYSYIHALHPRIEVTNEKINFYKYQLFEINKSSIKEVIIHVDSYIMPHLLLGIEQSRIDLTTPVYLTSYNENHLPQDTLNIFKGLADGTRLTIIKYLYDRPMSTQGLAIELSLTEACISKHLKILYKAGIVSKERDGNYINYHLNQRVIDSLVVYMYELISKQ